METLQRLHNRGSISTGPYQISNSLVLDNSDTGMDFNHQQMSPGGDDQWTAQSNAGTDSEKATVSLWFKRSKLSPSSGDGQYARLFHFITGGNATSLYFVDDQLTMYDDVTSASLKTNRKFRDLSAWYHVVVAMDSSQSTAANRVKIYVNGVQETSWATEDYGNQNTDLAMFSTTNVTFILGSAGGHAQGYSFDGYMTEVHFVDGAQKAASDFGEYDEDTGIWIPKQYTGSYGTLGCYYNFEDTSSNRFNDESGNGNYMDNRGGSFEGEITTDTPTNNFCTWNPLWAEDRANGTFTQGATQVAWGGDAWKAAKGSLAVSKGRWYWEIKGANVTGDTWNNNLFGFAATEQDGQTGPSVYIGYSTGNYYYRVAGSQTGSDNWGNAGGAWSSSDTFGFALDLESSTKKFILYRNGSAVNGSGTDLVSGFQTEQFFTPYATSYNGDTQFLNFGGYTVNTISSAASDANGYGTFEYAPPTGYYALCTKNLAEFG
jgi:hypothetical protein